MQAVGFPTECISVRKYALALEEFIFHLSILGILNNFPCSDI